VKEEKDGKPLLTTGYFKTFLPLLLNYIWNVNKINQKNYNSYYLTNYAVCAFKKINDIEFERI